MESRWLCNLLDGDKIEDRPNPLKFLVGISRADRLTVIGGGIMTLAIILIYVGLSGSLLAITIASIVVWGLIGAVLISKYLFLVPSEIVVLDIGFRIVFRARRDILYTWNSITRVYVTAKVGSTAADGGVWLANGKSYELSYEAALEIRRMWGVVGHMPH